MFYATVDKHQAEQQYLNMHTYIRVYIRTLPISVRSVGSTQPLING